MKMNGHCPYCGGQNASSKHISKCPRRGTVPTSGTNETIPTNSVSEVPSVSPVPVTLTQVAQAYETLVRTTDPKTEHDSGRYRQGKHYGEKESSVAIQIEREVDYWTGDGVHHQGTQTYTAPVLYHGSRYELALGDTLKIDPDKHVSFATGTAASALGWAKGHPQSKNHEHVYVYEVEPVDPTETLWERPVKYTRYEKEVLSEHGYRIIGARMVKNRSF